MKPRPARVALRRLGCAATSLTLLVLPGIGWSNPPSSSAPAAEIATLSPEELVLKAGTEVPMRTNTELNSRKSRQGDRFDLTVTEDVLVGGHVVIARGARGIGEITRLIPKGAFGKSGKLELRLLFVDAGNARLRLDGRAGDRGRSGTGATVVTAVLAGLFSAFVTGTSAKLPAGTTLVGYVERDMPIILRPRLP